MELALDLPDELAHQASLVVSRLEAFRAVSRQALEVTVLSVYPVLALAITEVAASMASMVTALAMQVITAVVSIQ